MTEEKSTPTDASETIGSSESTPAPPKAAATKAPPPGVAKIASREPEITRRGLFSWAVVGWVGFSAAIGGCMTAFGRFMFPNVLFEPPTSFKVGKPEDFPPGVVDERFKEANGVWIIHNEGLLTALIAIRAVNRPSLWMIQTPLASLKRSSTTPGGKSSGFPTLNEVGGSKSTLGNMNRPKAVMHPPIAALNPTHPTTAQENRPRRVISGSRDAIFATPGGGAFVAAAFGGAGVDSEDPMVSLASVGVLFSSVICWLGSWNRPTGDATCLESPYSYAMRRRCQAGSAYLALVAPTVSGGR